MSNYLSKLAARAAEQPQPIRPRLASLFEPVAGPKIHWTETTVNRRTRKPRSTELRHNEPSPTPRPVSNQAEPSAIDQRAEVVAAVPQAPKEPAADRPPSIRVSEPVTQPPPVLNEITHRSLGERSVPVEAATRTAPEPQQSVAVNQDQAIRDLPPSVIQIAPSIALEETTLIETRIESSPQSIPWPEAENVPPETPRGASVIVKPMVTANHAPPPSIEAPPAPEATPSSIRITIGRVDVRAIMPQSPPAAAARQTAAGGALSLDEYLKRRNGA